MASVVDSSDSGAICRADVNPLTCVEPSDGFLCSLPVRTNEDASDLLEYIGSGGTLGTGLKSLQIGTTMPVIREAYEREVKKLIEEVARRRRAGQSLEAIAEYTVKRRREIANMMRDRSGAGTRVLFEIRDWAEYGSGGRSVGNVTRRYTQRAYTGTALHEAMIKGATSPNTGISETAIRGARYLKNGGRVIVVFSIATTAYVLLTTPKEELPKVLAEEGGGFLGGEIGTGLAVGGCLVFGIATGGWGLLACGAVGGLVGGTVGTYAGKRAYLSASPEVEEFVLDGDVLPLEELDTTPAANMCVAPLTR